jgi:hypothetical protein
MAAGLSITEDYAAYCSGRNRAENVHSRCRYLALTALFFDHMIVPDGWLHCAGPISEYLRTQHDKASQAATAGAADEFDDNII